MLRLLYTSLYPFYPPAPLVSLFPSYLQMFSLTTCTSVTQLHLIPLIPLNTPAPSHPRIIAHSQPNPDNQTLNRYSLWTMADSRIPPLILKFVLIPLCPTSMPQVAVPDCSFLFYLYILYTPELTQNHLTLSPLLPLSCLLLQDGLASVPGLYFAPLP